MHREAIGNIGHRVAGKLAGKQRHQPCPLNQCRKEEPGQHYPNWSIQTQQRHRDRIKARRIRAEGRIVNCLLQIRPHNNQSAGSPGKGSGNRHRQGNIAAHVNTCIAGRLLALPNSANLIAQRRALHQEPVEDRSANRKQQPNIHQVALLIRHRAGNNLVDDM